LVQTDWPGASPQSGSDTWLVGLAEMERLRPRIVVGAHCDIGDASRGYDMRSQ
jgi:hypothetical protein